MKFGKSLQEFKYSIPLRYHSCVLKYNELKSNLGSIQGLHNIRAFSSRVDLSIRGLPLSKIPKVQEVLKLNATGLRKICKKFDKKNNTNVAMTFYEKKKTNLEYCFLSDFLLRQLQDMSHDCVICYDDKGKIMRCGHTLCDDCKNSVTKCPICRISL